MMRSWCALDELSPYMGFAYITNHNLKDYAIISHKGYSSENIAVSLSRKDAIAPNHVIPIDIILQYWMFEIFKSENVDIDFVDTAQELPSGCKLIFNFICKSISKNWDDSNSLAGINTLSTSWSSDIPQNLRIMNLENLLPSLIIGRCFISGQLFGVAILDCLMIFRISLELDANTEFDPTSNVDPLIIYTISNTKDKIIRVTYAPQVDNERTIISKKVLSSDNTHTLGEITEECTFIHSPLHYLLELARAVYSDNGQENILSLRHHYCWKGIRTILLTAPEGAGKSYLISRFQSKLSSQNRQPPKKHILIIQLSGNSATHNSYNTILMKKIEELSKLIASSSSSPPSSLSKTTTMNEQHQLIQSQIKLLILCLSNEYSEVINDNFKVTFPLLLLMEDCDMLLSRMMEMMQVQTSTEYEDNTTTYTSSQNNNPIMSFAATSLRQLLSTLTNPSCDCQCLLIATTSIPSSRIPNGVLIPPGFESLIELRRPIRKDREKIFISLITTALQSTASQLSPLEQASPDSNRISNASRKDILQDSILTNWCLRLSVLTPGHLPGDLLSILHLFLAIHNGKLSAQSVQKPLPWEWRDMLAALSNITPLQLKGLNLSYSAKDDISGQRLTWDDFAGYSQVKEKLKKILSRIVTPHPTMVEIDDTAVENFSTDLSASPSHQLKVKREQFLSSMGKDMGMSTVDGLLIYGPPGCGKTHLAKVIAAETAMNFVTVRSPEILSRYFGQTEASIRDLFARARSASPCVLFFDDFDCIAMKRGAMGSSDNDGHDGSSGLHGRILSTFLNELDGISGSGSGSRSSRTNNSSSNMHSQKTIHGFGGMMKETNNILVIVACSNIQTLDDALLRPGRLQYHFHLNFPTKEDVSEILTRRTRLWNLDFQLSIPTIIEMLFNLKRIVTCADVDALCRSTQIVTLRDMILNLSKEDEKDGGVVTSVDNNTSEYKTATISPPVSIYITMHHFEKALRELYGTLPHTVNSSLDKINLIKVESQQQSLETLKKEEETTNSTVENSFEWTGVYVANI